MRHTTHRTAATVALLMILGSIAPVVSVGAFVVADDSPQTSVRVAPSSVETNVSESTTFELLVDDADSGVGAYDLSIYLINGSVGTIKSVSVHGNPGNETTETTIGPDNDSAHVEAALMNTSDSGEVRILSVTVAGEHVGSSALDVRVRTVVNESGTPYNVTAVHDGTLAVSRRTIGPAEIRLSPSEAPISTNQHRTFSLIVDNVSGGIGAVDAEISISNSTVATIDQASISDPSASALTTVSFGSDNGTVSLKAAVLNTADTGSVVIGTVTLRSNETGGLSLSAHLNGLFNEQGARYAHTNVTNASVIVTSEVDGEVPHVGNFDDPPTDPDGDGLYEDVNGNGEANIVDVQAMFANRDDPALVENPQYFDISGNGEVDIVDVQALFVELTS